MTVELAFQNVDRGASQYTLTLYRKSSDGGVSLPKFQQRYISRPTYSLEIQWRRS